MKRGIWYAVGARRCDLRRNWLQQRNSGGESTIFTRTGRGRKDTDRHGKYELLVALRLSAVFSVRNSWFVGPSCVWNVGGDGSSSPRDFWERELVAKAIAIQIRYTIWIMDSEFSWGLEEPFANPVPGRGSPDCACAMEPAFAFLFFVAVFCCFQGRFDFSIVNCRNRTTKNILAIPTDSSRLVFEALRAPSLRWNLWTILCLQSRRTRAGQRRYSYKGIYVKGISSAHGPNTVHIRDMDGLFTFSRKSSRHVKSWWKRRWMVRPYIKASQEAWRCVRCKVTLVSYGPATKTQTRCLVLG